MPMNILRDDITKVSADIIVNTANPMPIYTTGIDKAIYEAAGAENLLRDREAIGEITRGDIAVTSAYALNGQVSVIETTKMDGLKKFVRTMGNGLILIDQEYPELKIKIWNYVKKVAFEKMQTTYRGGQINV